MTIVVTGGGSGGHITPILAVARELRVQDPTVRIVYIGQQGDALGDIADAGKAIDASYRIRAGKFRRYHGEGLRQVLDVATTLKNMRDTLYVLMGIWQSFWLLRRLRPSVIFVKGGFVGVPVGLSAAALHIPYITHDSDAIPGLANRIIARWASLHTVALPEELYPYPIDKTLTVGVPIDRNYQPVTPELQQRYKTQLRLQQYGQMVFVTGGGLGAARLNKAMIANAAYLLKRYPDLVIVHVTGQAHMAEVTKLYSQELPNDLLTRVILKDYVTDLYLYSGAADVVITRAGATSLAELAIQAKASIMVPNPRLTGGHQLRNAEALRKKGAVIELTEEQLEQELRLANTVIELLDDKTRRQQIARALSAFARPDASKRLARILLDKAAKAPAQAV